MSRKSIFQLVEENYNIYNEVEKINRLFSNEFYFVFDGQYRTFKEMVSQYLFPSWEYRGTCIDIEEFIFRANADINERDATEETIINYLEIIENFINLLNNSFFSDDEVDIQHHDDFETVFCKIVYELERKMGLVKRHYKNKVVMYPKNAPLEEVVDLCEDEDVQWELIRYARENMSLSEKRKSLAYFATNLYIEKDSKEQNDSNEQRKCLKIIIDNATNILNNLQIRHNNKTGKWENKVVKEIDEKDATELCDMVYNDILAIVLLRENIKNEKLLLKFRGIQKNKS